MKEPTFLTLEETAEILKVNIRHVRLMIASGKLRAKNVGIGKQRKFFRVLREDVMKIGNAKSR
jgi:excisionase family DNA binding protein